eukprot:CCRYP_020583-RA/>CCRYP_020583-RA protein AED:0.35 eAED:0.26 QI:0/-1/0/1/-1/1/1/0/1386
MENYYNILMDNHTVNLDKEDDKTIIISNTSTKHECDQASFTTADLTKENMPSNHKPPEYAILDSGATAHFIIKGATVRNKNPASDPLRIKLPDGSVITSTHTCNLDIPWLPNSVTEAHIVPGLAQSSLVATKKFCDAGCKITFDLDGCTIIYRGKVVLTGTRDPATGLWRVPINPTSPATTPRHHNLSPVKNDQPFAANLYTLPYKQQQLKYIHQSFFSPPSHTLIKAICNGQLEGIPFMTADLVRKYLAPSPATSKGRMKRPRQGIRSTRKWPPMNTGKNCPPQDTPSSYNTNATIIPIDECTCNVLCYAALADKHNGTMYTDATGALPAVTLEGNQYYFIAYAYDLNYIFAIPIPNLRDETILKAFDEVFQTLKSKGFKPAFNVTDNQAAVPIKTYLNQEQTSWQFVEPNNHRVNAAERAIQTYKNHFISGLCTTDSDWPLQLWDNLTEQALITLNLLRTSRVDPTKSAYHQLHGHKYDWNAHPLAPPGTKAIIYESPQGRASWGTRGLDAWYCGPSFDHYRNCKFYVPSTKSYRTSGSYDLFPQHCILPTFTPEQHTQEVYKELFGSIQTLNKPAKRTFLKKVAKALEVLATTPQPTSPTSEGVQNSEGDATNIVFQRVPDSPQVTTSNNPTNPTMIKTSQRVHQRHTRANTPGQLPAIINPANDGPPTRRSPRLSPIDEAPIITTQGPSSSRVPLHSPNLIAFQALNHLTQQVYTDPTTLWIPNTFLSSSPTDTTDTYYDVNIDHFCNGVQHPTTGETITKYQKLINIPQMKEVWTTAFGKEFGNLAQGDNKTGEKGTDSIFVMSHEAIAAIPKGRTVTYGRIVIDFRPQKADPNRVRITAGGNLIKDYPGEITTRTADITTSKILWNSILSTKGAKFMGIDIKSFYLTAPLDRYEYMKMPITVFPEHIIQQYNLRAHVKNGFVYLELRKCVYGLPMAGALANKLLRKRLAPHGYYEVTHTPGLWRHVTRPISFTLVVDDFGVKYEGQEHAQHLVDTLKKYYKLAEDWTGDLYCGIALDWDYNNRTLDITMPGYIDKVLQRFEHKSPEKPQHCPYQPTPRKYGTAAQAPIPPDTSDRLDLNGTRRVQQVVGSLLFYARAVDNTLLPGLSAIASDQAQATQLTMNRCIQILDYCASHPDAKVRFRASDMILNIHSDASYLSATRARSQVAGYYFLGSIPTDDAPIKLNGTILVFCGILKFVVASAAEAELGALFLNCREGKIQRLILEELGHPQPPTPIHCDNATATGISNDTVKKQRARAMEMQFFWVTDQVKQRFFNVRWQPGQENLADYFTKHFEPRHHLNVRPWYLHTSTSPSLLPRANAPSSLRGCVGTLPNGYTRASPLPRIPSAKCRVPLGRQLSGLLHRHHYITAPICVRAASMA